MSDLQVQPSTSAHVPETRASISSVEHLHRLIRERIRPRMAELRQCQSTPDLHASAVYHELEDEITQVLETPETGYFSKAEAPARASYRWIAWNLERGIEFEGQLEAFRNHPYLRTGDVFLLTETDVGMARSANRAVAQELAAELGMHFAFVPCYLNLSKGSGLEYDSHGENDLGLHGNAILSRYPIRRMRPVHLKNGIDKMTRREKRIGRQTALAAEIEFPNSCVTAVCVHLDANSTQRHRAEQMQDVLEAVEPSGATLIGGDWNTTTYNSSRAFHAIAGFWLRVFMGVDRVIRRHYLHPYNHFERELFESLEKRGFDYRTCNLAGEYTISYDVYDPKTRKNLGEWVPAWCFPFIRWALREHGGKCPLKIDWFATRGVRPQNPVVVHDLREGRNVPLSDHDAIGVDIPAEGAEQ